MLCTARLEVFLHMYIEDMRRQKAHQLKYFDLIPFHENFGILYLILQMDVEDM